VGRTANGSDSGAALGWAANGAVTGVAVGGTANGYNNGAAMGYLANGVTYGAAVGASANGYDNGAAVGRSANGSDYGAAVGSWANGYFTGAAVGYAANGYYTGAAVGPWANGYNYGAAMGYLANGTNYGAAVGASANGYNNGAAMGYAANGAANGAAVGASANGARTNVAIGLRANARGGTNHIAIGYNVTNNLGNDTAVIRGTLYLDGGSGVYTNTGFGSSSWTLKTFEIDHPLDPENKILRHYCLESPQVWNVYAGNAQLVNGRAEVQLPDYYSALNLVGAEIYSLTPIGEALVWVESEVSDGHFVIAGKRDMKVSWTIKVLRNDPGCLEDLRRRPVEQLKSELQSGQAEGK
ncbi:MAG: hypothetical protein HYV35_00050, partial [Lentisphaerae bacterium]|nr:hypothetical protein [Lentisphaerota bacterium]